VLFRSVQTSLGTQAQPTEIGFSIQLPIKSGATVAVFIGNGTAPTTMTIAQAMSDARAKLVSRFAKFGVHNETYAGMQIAISWNTVYTPYEGIFTPVFRGSPWDVAKAHNYVLFEWDTYLSSMIAAHTDLWVAKSNIIRMTKSLIYAGYVAGFWNGLCGEVDKSKPPVGAFALEYLISLAPDEHLWLAELLFDQLLMWNRWWEQSRMMSDGALAPGSTRQMYSTPLNCINQDPEGASRCETGLDNSPLYMRAGYDATFVAERNVIDSVDVGMTALYARDALALGKLARRLGRLDAAEELEQRSARLARTLNKELWNEDEGIYLNKMWQTNEWVPNDKSGSLTVAPTYFYPMLAKVPSDLQVRRLVSRWLANDTEFCVLEQCTFGMPSISRSSSAFKDNDYWRGRAWGPMNLLVYFGLLEYPHLAEVASARRALSAQSEATFLPEWVKHHRVMENYNSVSGEGCDVGSAIPFYHWGALMAFLPLKEAGLLEKVAAEVEIVV